METAHSKDGTVVQLNVRGKLIPAQVYVVYVFSVSFKCMLVSWYGYTLLDVPFAVG